MKDNILPKEAKDGNRNKRNNCWIPMMLMMITDTELLLLLLLLQLLLVLVLLFHSVLIRLTLPSCIFIVQGVRSAAL